MNFTLNQLCIFLKVVKTKNITKAAQELCLTQPAVSIQLKNFQNQFNLPLIELINRRLFVTEFGYEIAKAAEKIVNEINEINYKTALFNGEIAGKLSISVVSTGKYVIPYFLTTFLQENQHVELLLDVSNKAQIIADLTENTVDFSLVSQLPSDLNLEKITLMKNELFLVCSSSLNIESVHSLADLSTKFPFIFRELGSATRKIMESFIDQNGIVLKKKMELTSNEAIKQALLAEMGISIMPIIGIRNELKNNQLKIIPIDGLPICTNWHIVWNKGKKLNPTAKAFIDHLTMNKEKIIEQFFPQTQN